MTRAWILAVALLAGLPSSAAAWDTIRLEATPKSQVWESRPYPAGTDAEMKIYLGKKLLPYLPLTTKGAVFFANNSAYAKVILPTGIGPPGTSERFRVRYSTKTGFRHRHKTAALTIKYRTFMPDNPIATHPGL